MLKSLKINITIEMIRYKFCIRKMIHEIDAFKDKYYNSTKLEAKSSSGKFSLQHIQYLFHSTIYFNIVRVWISRCYLLLIGMRWIRYNGVFLSTSILIEGFFFSLSSLMKSFVLSINIVFAFSIVYRQWDITIHVSKAS